MATGAKRRQLWRAPDGATAWGLATSRRSDHGGRTEATLTLLGTQLYHTTCAGSQSTDSKSKTSVWVGVSACLLNYYVHLEKKR